MELSLSTLCDWVRQLAGVTGRVVEQMKAEQRRVSWLLTDGTGIPVLDGTPGKTGSGRLWVYVSKEHVVYEYTASKEGKNPVAHLKGFSGVLVADGGSEFNAVIRAMGLTRAGCWSHARRYFWEAKEEDPKASKEILALYQELFEAERKIAGAALEERRRARSDEILCIITKIKTWLSERVNRYRPKSGMGAAVRYSLNQWESLEVCVKHPEIPIHNNMSELQLRTPVIGRKNWLFAGSEGGAEAAATLFSLMSSARLQRLDPWEYLTWMLGKIGDTQLSGLSELTPAAYARQKSGALAG